MAADDLAVGREPDVGLDAGRAPFGGDGKRRRVTEAATGADGTEMSITAVYDEE